MASMQPVTIACPACGERLVVPCKLISEDVRSRTVTVDMDYAGARAHFQECARRAATQPQEVRQDAGGQLEHKDKSVPAVRATFQRIVPPFVRPGARACTMCGITSGACFQQLTSQQVACCGACGQGDTHPVPDASLSCAEWAAQQGAQQ